MVKHYFPVVVWLLGLSILTAVMSCDNPADSPPVLSIRAMAPDGRRLIIGLPDVLSSPVTTSMVEVVVAIGSSLPIISTTLDSVSGTLLEVELGTTYDLRTPLVVTLNGLVYERGELVSEKAITLNVMPGVLYERDIAPLFATHCNVCHGPDVSSGNYRTDVRDSLYAFGSDVSSADRSPNLIPGNDRCQLAVKTSYKGREFRRADLSFFESELIRQWILNGDATDHRDSATVACEAHPADFTHLRVSFSAVPDSAAASAPERYHIADLDASDATYTPLSVIVDSVHRNLVLLSFPQQKLFHRYRLLVDGLVDRFGNLMFDSAQVEYRALLSYQADIAPLLTRACTRCHQSGLADSLRGNYLTDSYAALFTFGSDSLSEVSERNLIPTDTSCLLAVKTRQIVGKTGLCALRAPLSPLESHRIADWIISYYARQQ